MKRDSKGRFIKATKDEKASMKEAWLRTAPKIRLELERANSNLEATREQTSFIRKHGLDLDPMIDSRYIRPKTSMLNFIIALVGSLLGIR